MDSELEEEKNEGITESILQATEIFDETLKKLIGDVEKEIFDMRK